MSYPKSCPWCASELLISERSHIQGRVRIDRIRCTKCGWCSDREKEKYRLIHVSDLHVRKDMRHNGIVREKLSIALSMMDDRSVLVVTGDITDDGHKEQYNNAASLLWPFIGRLVLIPGNHDFGPLGNFYSRECVKRFAEFRHALQADKPYMFRDGTGKATGAILPLDTNRRTGSPVDFAQGEVGWFQRLRLKRKLEAMKKAGACSVVIMHHSPLYEKWYGRLLDAQEFLGVVLGRADVVLMGHSHSKMEIHFPMDHPVENAQTRLYCAGALKYENTPIDVVEISC